MFTVKLFGGAKKSFLANQLNIDQSNISIQSLLEILPSLQPANTPLLDVENILIAINGSDSSTMQGKATLIKENDVVSIIPLIHGGSSQKNVFKILKKNIQVIEIKGQKNIDHAFLEDLRKRYSKIQIQAISSQFILNSNHLKKILLISLESENKKILLSKKLETDILMRFALTSQISDAIKKVGIRPKSNFILIAIGTQKLLNSLNTEISSFSIPMFSKNNSSFLKKQFKITKKQIDSVYSDSPLEDILAEKAAILF